MFGHVRHQRLVTRIRRATLGRVVLDDLGLGEVRRGAIRDREVTHGELLDGLPLLEPMQSPTAIPDAKPRSSQPVSMPHGAALPIAVLSVASARSSTIGS